MFFLIVSRPPQILNCVTIIVSPLYRKTKTGGTTYMESVGEYRTQLNNIFFIYIYLISLDKKAHNCVTRHNGTQLTQLLEPKKGGP